MWKAMLEAKDKALQDQIKKTEIAEKEKELEVSKRKELLLHEKKRENKLKQELKKQDAQAKSELEL